MDFGKYILLEVVDNGKCIPESDLKEIFLPYFTTKKKGEGTGLGLSIVDRIVKDIEGNIEVESEAGKGTKFFFIFSSN